MNCNLCGKDKFKLVFKGNIQGQATNRFSQYAYYADIFRCSSCGLMIQNVTEDVQTIIKLLSAEKYLDENIGLLNLKEKNIQFQKLANFVKRYVTLENSTVLDVGANTGVFLQLLKKHSGALYGIEPSVEAAKYCISQGLNVQNTVISGAKLKDDFFDIITMWDVVEHLYEPNSDLGSLLLKMKPGGKIFISTHNITGLFAKLTGARYPMLMYQHFFHFSKQTLAKMLETNGYKVLGFTDFCKSWSIAYLYELLDKLWPDNRFIHALKFILKPIVSINWIASIQLTLPIRNFFVMVAERPISPR